MPVKWTFSSRKTLVRNKNHQKPGPFVRESNTPLSSLTVADLLDSDCTAVVLLYQQLRLLPFPTATTCAFISITSLQVRPSISASLPALGMSCTLQGRNPHRQQTNAQVDLWSIAEFTKDRLHVCLKDVHLVRTKTVLRYDMSVDLEWEISCLMQEAPDLRPYWPAQVPTYCSPSLPRLPNKASHAVLLSGTGLSRNLQRGSQPSRTSKTNNWGLPSLSLAQHDWGTASQIAMNLWT